MCTEAERGHTKDEPAVESRGRQKNTSILVYRIDKRLVEQRWQKADDSQCDGEGEAKQCLGLIGLDVGKQPPEGLSLPQAVGADPSPLPEGAAARGTVLDDCYGIGLRELIPFRVLFLDQAGRLDGLALENL